MTHHKTKINSFETKTLIEYFQFKRDYKMTIKNKQKYFVKTAKIC